MNTIGELPATKKDVEIAVEKAVDTIADMIGKGFAYNDMRFDAPSSHDCARLKPCSWKSRSAGINHIHRKTPVKRFRAVHLSPNRRE
jgi:hypothetical protein